MTQAANPPAYDVVPEERGFVIVPNKENRRTVRVTLADDSMSFNLGAPRLPKSFYAFDDVSVDVIDYYKLIDRISVGLMMDWKRPAEKENRLNPSAFDVHGWAHKQCGKSINKRVYAQWKRLLTLVDPVILAVQKKVFAVSMGGGDWRLLRNPSFYEHKLLVHDILHYRAAAIAAVYWSHMRDSVWFKETCPIEDREWYETDNKPGFGDEQIDLINQLENNWRGAFSSDGRSYTSLNRTLMNLPGGISGRMLAQMQRVKLRLPAPATERIKLLAYIYAGSYNARQNTTEATAMVQRSTVAKIRRAIEIVWRYDHTKSTFRNMKNITSALSLMMDCPLPLNGCTLAGFAERSVEWHRDTAAREVERQLQFMTQDTDYLDREVAKPPIALPQSKHVTFLDSVQAIVKEGTVMGHCISSYAESAVEGRCYLFHVDYADETASVEVDPDGRVVQARGPKNVKNKAALFGQRVLQKWGKEIPPRTASRYEPEWAAAPANVVAYADEQIAF